MTVETGRRAQADEGNGLAPAPRIPVRIVPSFGWVFLLTVLVGALLVPVVNLLLVNRSNDVTVSWLGDVYRRKDVYAERTAQAGKPRLFLVGGSASLFGIDCELIERKLGMPAVDYATHAGLGVRYLLARARRVVRPGDTVLLALEYSLCWSDEYARELRRDFVLTYDKSYLRELGIIPAADFLYRVPLTSYDRSVNAWWEGARGRERFGPYSLVKASPNGDIRHIARRDRTFEAVVAPELDPELLGEVRQFIEWCRGRGAKVLATWPNAWYGEEAGAVERMLPAIEPYRRVYEAAGAPVIEEPGDAAFPRFMFMDTHYHLDQAGRRVRTEKLIRALRPHLGMGEVKGDGGVFVMGSHEQALTAGNVMADRPGVRYAYLSEQGGEHPDVVRPEGVAAMVREGREVLLDGRDEVAKGIVEKVGLAVEPVASAEVTMGELTHRYPDHVFLTVKEEGGTYSASMVGTGRYAGVSEVRTGEGEVSIAYRKGETVDGWVAPVTMALRSGPGGKQVTLNITKVADGDSGGVTVVVLEPEIGVVLESHAFVGGKAKAWQVDRVVVPPGSRQQGGN